MGQATLSPPPATPAVPSDLGSTRATQVRFASAINQALRGGISATMGITLCSNDTSSTFSDSRIGPYSSVTLAPATAHAADVLPSCWIETTAGAATIHHANVPYTDCTFVGCFLG